MSEIFERYPIFDDHISGKECFCHPDIFENSLGETVINHQSVSNLAAKLDAATARAEAAEAENEKLERENARYEDALQQIDNWARAYPLDIFPEPDFARVNEVLTAAGISLSCVSAANMRHVIEGVERITAAALRKE